VKLNSFIVDSLISLLKVPAYIVFLLICTACVSTNSKIQLTSSAIDDPKYQPVLDKWRKSASTYRDLDLILKTTAVLISPEMDELYKNRFIDIHGSQAKFDDKIILSKDTISVVVDLFTKSEAHLDLSDESLWKIQLIINGIMIRPQSIDRYRKKELLSPFFPLSSSWSRYYVLVFKLPFDLLMGNEVKDLFEKKELASSLPNPQDRTIVLSMNSGEAQVKFSWDP
jgi:hypothetical protein